MPGFELLGDEELSSITEVFSNGGVLFRHGFEGIRNNCFKVRDFELAFAERMKTKHALAVSSGTAALRVALASLGIGTNDEVVTQSFTFVATVEAIVESGATPICTEINETLNMDPADLITKIGPNTKAVIVVHMLGTPANMTEIAKICKDHDLWLIEDTAWGCGGSYDGTPLGSYGDVGTYSFDYAKTLTTGEGGMVTFKEIELFAKAAAWHDHGHENNKNFPRWEDTRQSSGFNFRMMELQGAVGIVQLKKLDYMVQQQRKNHAAIVDQLQDFKNIELRHSPDKSFSTADSLIFLTEDNVTAKKCRSELLEVGISTKILPEAVTWHFAKHWDHIPSLAESHNNDLASSFPISDQILNRSVSLPINVKMDDDVPIKIKKALSKVLS